MHIVYTMELYVCGCAHICKYLYRIYLYMLRVYRVDKKGEGMDVVGCEYFDGVYMYHGAFLKFSCAIVV